MEGSRFPPMSLRSSLLSTLPLLTALGTLAPATWAWRDNGKLALAPVFAGIQIDGKLDDWPADRKLYPVRLPEYGDSPFGTEDLQAFFSTVFNAEENTIFFGLEVHDSSIVIVEDPYWGASDGAVVFLHFDHANKNAPIRQYNIYGDTALTSRVENEQAPVEVAWTREQGIHRYEWAFHLDRLENGRFLARDMGIIGMDVVVCDRDDDGSFSWVSWGPGVGKTDTPSRLGDLLLVSPERRVAELRGRVSGAGGHALSNARVDIRGLGNNAPFEALLSDSSGRFETQLPTDRYELRVEGFPVQGFELESERPNRIDLALENPTPRAGPLGPGLITEPLTDNRRGAIHEYDIAAVLDTPRVLCFAQTEPGRVWLGTPHGLADFDGEYIVRYTEADGLPSQRVQALASNPEGALWIGTKRGLACLENGNLRLYSTLDGLAADSVRAILVDEHGVLVGGPGGLARLVGESFSAIPSTAALSVLDIERDGAGSLWIACLDGLYRASNSTSAFQRFGGEASAGESIEGQVSASWVSRRVADLATDASGNLLVSARGGSVRIEGSRIVPLEVPLRGAFAQETTIVGAPDGSTYVGLTRGGVRRVDTSFGQFHFSRPVNALFCDAEGDLWIAQDGLARIDNSHRMEWGPREGLAKLYSFGETRDGRLFVCTSSGLRTLVEDRWVELPQSAELPSRNVRCVVEGADKDLWVGTDDGLYRLRVGHTPERIAALPSQLIIDLLFDSRGRVWVATERGLARLAEGRTTIYSTLDGLPHESLRRVIERRDGSIWTAGFGGITRIEPAGVASFETAVGLGIRRIYEIFETRKGDLVVCTDRGVLLNRGGNFEPLEIELDAPTVVEDLQGRLWIGTPTGVFVTDGWVLQNPLRSVDLPSPEVVDLRLDRDTGELWVATRNGILIYEPRDQAPEVRLSSIHSGSTFIEPPNGIGTIEVTARAGPLVLEVSETGHHSGKNGTLLRYRLAEHGGEPEAWRTTREGRIEYFDLPRGHYRFELQAISRDLTYAKQPLLLDISVGFPWGYWLGRLSLGAAALAALGMAALALFNHAKIRKINAQLENRVQARTDRLLHANEELEQEILNRRQAETRNAELQEELLQSQKMEAVGTLSAGVAHDFNNALTAVIGFAELGNMGARSLGSQDAFRGILRACEQATSITNSLLTLSGRKLQCLEPVALRELLHKSVQMLQPLVPATIEIVTLGLERQEVWINADENRIHQVLVNLTVNARDAMPEGGRLTLAVLQLPAQDPDKVTIEITDEGHGMHAEQCARIFEPFYSTKPRGQGTGLGLSVAYGIVQSHGGEIEVESEPGQGTTFRLRLPLCLPPDEPTTLTPMPRREKGNGELILVVEDDPQVQKSITALLNHEGYRVVLASDGRRALAEYDEWQGELAAVLLDVDLPKLRGDRVLARIREKGNVPVLMMSGLPEDARAIPDNVSFLVKPFGGAALLAALHKIHSDRSFA